MMLTTKKLELSDREKIEIMSSLYPPYNDFDFISLWTYNVENSNQISTLNGNLVIRIHDFVTGEFFYSFLGSNKTLDTIETLLRMSKEENLNLRLRLVPMSSIGNVNVTNDYYTVTEDPDSFDYILSTLEIADLKGKKYYDKRNLVNRFMRLYPSHDLVELDFDNPITRIEIKELFFTWEKQKKMDRSQTKFELNAIERFLLVASMCNIKGLGIYINNKLVGFITYHLVGEYAIISFQKANVEYQGIYPYLLTQVAKKIKQLNVPYINYEQDLGIPSLKKAKQLWRPIYFLKKYTIESK